MKKLPVHEILVPIFDVTIRVYYGHEGSEARDAIESWIHRNTRDAFASSQAYVHGASDRIALWIHPGSIGNDALIVHEVVHIVWRIFKHIGVENVDQEIFAWLTEWIFSEIKKKTG